MALRDLFKRVVRVIYRSAISGRFVSRDYARKHPSTTVAERVEDYTDRDR